MGSDPQSNLTAMDEMAHRECREAIDRLQNSRNRWVGKSAEWQARAENAERLMEKLRAALGSRGKADCPRCGGEGIVILSDGRITQSKECPCRKELAG